ncbi:MAG: T9SS type A sorting domain-containing protein [Bacteroidia bacterium]|nr:T9SS type A sorting domain-containing protein [Bacteroidia bacterium]
MKKIYAQLFALVVCLCLSSYTKSQSEIMGVTASGGSGLGTIFSLPTGSTGIASQYVLPGSPGLSPQYTKLLQASNGKLYGVTLSGGFNNAGVLFEYDTAASAYSWKFDFGGTNGISPRGSLIEAGGKLYGMTQLGGANNLGVIFEYDYTTNTFTKKIDFTGTTGTAMGGQPFGTLVDVGGNKLYGVTRIGGANNFGVIFEYDYSTNTYTKKIDFNGNVGSAMGSLPNGQLVLAGGSLYGLASTGGTAGVGTLFEYNHSTNTFTKKVDMTSANGQAPQGSLMLASNGNLYGTTVSGGGGAPAGGVIFEYNVGTSTYTKLYDFVGSGINGATPNGDLLQASNGKLYGMTRLGGSNGQGVIFEYDLGTSTYTKKIDFTLATTGGNPLGTLMQVNTGKIYGLASSGGAGSGGTLFHYSPTSNTFTKKVDLNTSNNGGPCHGGLTLANNGLYYGMTNVGGANSVGTIFEYAKTSNTYTKKIDLTTANGSLPFGALVKASNNKLYGLTSGGGSNSLGTLFEYDPGTNTYTKRADFNGNASTQLGGVPYGSLVEFSGNSKLYGICKQGGSSNQGTIFEFDPATNTFTKKIDMAAANGYSAFGSMVESSSKLYGMTSLGGANGLGAIFEYDPATNTYTKKIDFTGTSGLAAGSSPFGSMVQSATVGVLYGMTKTGGANDKGVIFEYNVSTNTYTKKIDLASATGEQPLGSMILTANGKLYGLTNQGGTNSFGVIFEYDPNTNTYTKKVDFTGTNGQSPSYTRLVEICTLPSAPGSITTSNGVFCETDATAHTFSVAAVSGATGYVWTFPAGTATNSGATTNNISVNHAAIGAGTYSYGVAATNICGTGTLLSTSNITVNSRPSISVNSGSICSGNSFTIQITGANINSIQGGTNVVSPGTSNTYTVDGISAQGCLSSNTATASVTVYSLPVVSVNSGSSCPGTNFTITANGANTYTFSNGTVSSGANIVAPTTNTVYTVAGTDLNGCISSNTATSTVTMYSVPVISVNSGSICFGGSHVFSPGGGTPGTYSMTGGFTGTQFTVNPSSSASYTFMGKSSDGCVSSFPATGNVTVYALPTLSLNSGTICSGQSHTFVPAGGAAGTYTIQGGSLVVSPPVGNAIFTVTGRSPEGCFPASPASATVVVNSLPTIGMNSGTICFGQTHTFTPFGGASYVIQGGSSTVSPPVGVNIFTITGLSAQGCAPASPGSATVMVNGLPTVGVNSGSICLGNSFTLQPTGVLTSGYYTVTPAVPSNSVVSPTSSTSYSVRSISPFGCASQSFAIANVVVLSLPNISASSGVICAGDVFTTTVGGANTYTYTDGVTSFTSLGATTLNPLTTTSYSVSGTNSSGCVSSVPAVMTVTVNQLPPVVISGTNAVCEGGSATLTASGATNYNWGTSLTAVAVFTPTSTTTYTVIGTDANNCEQSATYTVTWNALPVINVFPAAICPGNSHTFTPSGAVTYTYSSGSPIVSPLVTTSYSITGTSAAGCVSGTPAVVTVSVVNILTVTITGNLTICKGQTTTLTANGASTYTWNTSEATTVISHTPNVTTTYSVIGASGTCSNTAVVEVTVNALPTVSVSATSSSLCVGETATLTGSGATNYSWGTLGNSQTIVVSPATTTTYTLVGTDANNCSAQVTSILTVDPCLGVDKYSGSNLFSIYPNPTLNDVTIEVAQPYKVTVLNALGQVVSELQLNPGKNELTLNREAKGIYFVRFEQNGAVKTVKIVKQ